MRLSVIIPAYNDEKHIRDTILDIHKYVSEHYPDHEIIVCVDGSKDKTPDIVKNLADSIPTLKFNINPVNHGKGFVVKQGMMQAGGDVRIFTDADNSTSIDHLEKMLPFLSEGYDVIIASIAVAMAPNIWQSRQFVYSNNGCAGNQGYAEGIQSIFDPGGR